MADLPDGMFQLDKPIDDVFPPDEYLYRRVPHEWLDDDYIYADALELPDMSVNRGKYSRPEWVRLLSDGFRDWGVIGFQVKDIPAELQNLGVHIFRFRPKHVPQKRNYPHSEVQAYYSKAEVPEIEDHINKEWLKKEQIQQLDTVFPDELQLRWREQ